MSQRILDDGGGMMSASSAAITSAVASNTAIIMVLTMPKGITPLIFAEPCISMVAVLMKALAVV